VLDRGPPRTGHGGAADREETLSTERLRTLLEQAFPDASELQVADRTGAGDHFQVTVVSDRFNGLSLVQQHKLVYEALADPLADGTIHELRISTKGLSP
jgi:stress-induced morphogen